MCRLERKKLRLFLVSVFLNWIANVLTIQAAQKSLKNGMTSPLKDVEFLVTRKGGQSVSAEVVLGSQDDQVDIPKVLVKRTHAAAKTPT
jgi:hypothetical protein